MLKKYIINCNNKINKINKVQIQTINLKLSIISYNLGRFTNLTIIIIVISMEVQNYSHRNNYNKQLENKK